MAILESRQDEISPRTRGLITGLYEDRISLDERVESLSGEIDQTGEKETDRRCLMSIPGIGPPISTAVVAAIGTGEAFERGRDLGAWLSLVPQHRRPIHSGPHLQTREQVPQNPIIPANVILMRPHNWECFSFGAWLRNAAPRLHRNKLATANKLARIAWSILRNETALDAPRHEVMAI